MDLVAIYAVTLMVAVLVSDLTQRSVLSTAVLFLAVGFGASALFNVAEEVSHPVVQHVAEIALVSTLFSDSMRLPVTELRRAWRLPGRALFLGLPLTLLLTAALAHWIADLSWMLALLVGAALSPTDPVLASAIVGESRVPTRLRHLLNVESGLNDGLALPCVVVLMHLLQSQKTSPIVIGAEVGGGVLLGVALSLGFVGIYRTGWFGAAPLYRPLFAFAILMMAWSLGSLVHANPFLATFAAGVTISSISDKARKHFEPMGERLAELLKLAALFVFGTMITVQSLRETGVSSWIVAAGVLVVARPVAILVALLFSELDWRERLTAAWFGPRGFASVVFGLMIADSSIYNAQNAFHVIAATIVLSIVVHSSTDVMIARWFPEDLETDAQTGEEAESQSREIANPT